MDYGQISSLFLTELLEAEEQHPGWPQDVIHAAAIASEEKGELLKASIDFYFGRGSREELIKEAVQMGAMATRFLMHVEDYEPNEDQMSRETKIKYLRKKYNMDPLENRITDINEKQHGSVKIEGLNPKDKK